LSNRPVARRADRPQLNWGVSPRTTDQCVVAADRAIRQLRRVDRAGGLVRRPSAGPVAPQSLYRDGVVRYGAARSIPTKSLGWAPAHAGPCAPRAGSGAVSRPRPQAVSSPLRALGLTRVAT